jgi:hypothetical protein
MYEVIKDVASKTTNALLGLQDPKTNARPDLDWRMASFQMTTLGKNGLNNSTDTFYFLADTYLHSSKM